jgi:hypothetical protein
MLGHAVAPKRCIPVVARQERLAAKVSLDCLLQNGIIERQLSHELLELRVLPFELSEALDLLGTAPLFFSRSSGGTFVR